MSNMPKSADSHEPDPLVTECPGCHTRFRVSEAQLQRARGRVRCGACLTVFNGVERLDWGPNQSFADEAEAQRALDALLDELAADQTPGERDRPEAPSRPAPERKAEPEPEPEPGPEPALRPEPVREATLGPAAEAERPPAVAPAVAPTPAAAPPPAAAKPTAVAPPTGEARPPPAVSPSPLVFGEPRRRRPWLWLALPLAVLLLAAQVLWWRFDEWATDPFWRGVYAPVCEVLGCTLPVQRDITRLATRQLAVRTHPDEPGALQVTAVIVNEAEFAQPFPLLELRFTTTRGLLVAGRRFAPEAYLSGDARGMTSFPPRTPVQIQLTIDDPGPDAVNYFLRFR